LSALSFTLAPFSAPAIGQCPATLSSGHPFERLGEWWVGEIALQKLGIRTCVCCLLSAGCAAPNPPPSWFSGSRKVPILPAVTQPLTLQPVKSRNSQGCGCVPSQDVDWRGSGSLRTCLLTCSCDSRCPSERPPGPPDRDPVSPALQSAQVSTYPLVAC
jgi:hypothetical protein